MNLVKILATFMMASIFILESYLKRVLKCDVPSTAMSSKEYAFESSIMSVDQIVLESFLPFAK